MTGALSSKRKAAARTHCPYGHEYTEENTYHCPTTGRQCIICKRRAKARFEARRDAHVASLDPTVEAQTWPGRTS